MNTGRGVLIETRGRFLLFRRFLNASGNCPRTLVVWPHRARFRLSARLSLTFIYLFAILFHALVIFLSRFFLEVFFSKMSLRFTWLALIRSALSPLLREYACARACVCEVVVGKKWTGEREGRPLDMRTGAEDADGINLALVFLGVPSATFKMSRCL